MDEFLIPSAAGAGSLLFFDRSPPNPAQPLEYFWVRVTDQNLSATTRVWEGYAPCRLPRLFAEMAQHWTGWPGELGWESLEHEFALRCSCDRFGHVSLRVELQSGFMPNDWRVRATVMAEAGQLAAIAQRAASFFGHTAINA